MPCLWEFDTWDVMKGELALACFSCVPWVLLAFLSIHAFLTNQHAGVCVRVLMQVLINFTMGLIMALMIFIFGLWSIIRSYQPSPIVAVAFFLCAACAAFSFVISYLLAIYGAAAGGLYGVAKLAETNQRARLQEQQRRQYVGYGGDELIMISTVSMFNRIHTNKIR